jgi:chemotaxis receptor (MCP) glutamine deamidase CheD
LFVGHAEVLNWLSERLEARQGGIYRLRSPNEPQLKPTLGLKTTTAVAPPPAPRPSAPAPSRPSPAKLPRQSAPRQPISPGHSEALKIINIHVGEAHSSTQPVEIKTLLGSCVAACLYDPVAKIGGMNHFLLPSSSTAEQIDRQRFGIHAMETLINALMKLGADRTQLKAKLFGGGNVLPNITRHPTVGEQNASFAEEFLRKEHIELVSSRLGGETGVEVRFHPHSGRAFVRDISREFIDLSGEENQTTPKISGEAELF